MNLMTDSFVAIRIEDIFWMLTREQEELFTDALSNRYTWGDAAFTLIKTEEVVEILEELFTPEQLEENNINTKSMMSYAKYASIEG